MQSATKGVILLNMKCSNAWGLRICAAGWRLETVTAIRKSQRTFRLVWKLRLSASGYVALCMRHKKGMVNDTHLSQSATRCLPSMERCKTTSYLTGYLIGQICGFRICGRHFTQFVSHFGKMALALYSNWYWLILTHFNHIRNRFRSFSLPITHQ